MIELRPQQGPQEQFLSSPADIAIYGGSVGGGKTYALLLEPLRHMDNPGFGVVIFRRDSGQITNEGGLWDNAKDIYRPLGATFMESAPKRVIFPSGAKITFNHLHTDDAVYGYQGAQVALICFDELTHFSEKQFTYMLSRNRSTCGVRPYVRATCNPDSDSWVARFISWWIDQDTGYAIPERSGLLRYFIRIDGEIHWADTPDELAAEFRVSPELCKSATFISSSIFDNKVLLKADPGYLASLNALSLVEKERLLRGNWKIRPAAGLYFKRDMFRIVHDLLNASDVRALMVNTAMADRAQYKNVQTVIPQDPGQAGKDQAASLASLLAGFRVSTHTVTGSKITRAEPFAAQVQHGAVMVMAGAWNQAFFDELEGFPDALHDDQVDAASDAFKAVARSHDWTALIS